MAQVLHTERATAAMKFRGPVFLILRLDTGLSPGIIVFAVAAAITHCVDGTGTAQYLAPWPVHAPAVQFQLWFGLVGPQDGVETDQLGQSSGHMNKGMPVLASSLQQQHAIVGILAEAAGQNTTC